MSHLSKILTILLLLQLGISSSAYNPWIESIENYLEQNKPMLPVIEPFINEKLVQAAVCTGDAGQYYLTGQSEDSNPFHSGIRLWRSTDLRAWSPQGDNGYVWSIQSDGTAWQKKILESSKQGGPLKITSRIYYFHRNYWITYTFDKQNVSGILKSTNGRPQGPYVDLSPDEPLVKGANAAMFEDENKNLWFIYGHGNAQQIKADHSGLIPSSLIKLNLPPSINANTLFTLSTVNGEPHIVFANWTDSRTGVGKTNGGIDENWIHARFDAMVSKAASLKSGFSAPVILLPHGGNCQLFVDFDKKIKAVVAGSNDVSSPFRGAPALVNMEKLQTGQIVPKPNFPLRPAVDTRTLYVSIEGDNSNGSSWQTAFTNIQRAIDVSGDNTQIWISQGVYDAPVRINLKSGIYIYGGFRGDESALDARNPEKQPVIINGRRNAHHVLFISSSSYIRLDGLTIRGGNASGQSFTNRYGGGLNLLGGGETIRIVNCIFENNSADQDGGAIYASLGASPVLINCIIRNNIAKNNGGAIAIYANSYNGYHPQLYNCIIENNTAVLNGGAIFFDTDQVESGLLKLTNCIITKNQTFGEYGNIAIDRNGSLIMNHCVFALNKGNPDGAVAGRMGRVPARNLISNSVFFQNEGGILFNIEGEAGRRGSSKQAISWIQFANCSFAENSTAGIVKRNFDGKTWRNHLELNDGQIGSQNNNMPPLFADPYQGNFKLQNNSTLRNKGSITYSFPFNMLGQRRYSAGQASQPVTIGAY